MEVNVRRDSNTVFFPHGAPGDSRRAASKKLADKARAKAAPTDLVGQLQAENAELEEDDWIDGQLPTYD